VKPVSLALWIPCIVGALGVHALVATLAHASPSERVPRASADETVFHLSLGTGRIVLGERLFPPWFSDCRASPPPARAAVWLPDIEREIQAHGRDHPWAGQYTVHGRLLVIAPRCGAWDESDGYTSTGRVECGEHDGTEWILACGKAYVPVHWGPRHYLIKQAEWHRFVLAVRSGEEPRRESDGAFLLRAGDESLPVRGVPQTLGTP